MAIRIELETRCDHLGPGIAQSEHCTIWDCTIWDCTIWDCTIWDCTIWDCTIWVVNRRWQMSISDASKPCRLALSW